MSFIQITKSGTEFSRDDESINKLHTEFDQKYCIKLLKFLKEDFLHYIQSQIKQSEFYEVNYPASGQDNPMLRIKDTRTENMLNFLVNDPPLYQVIEKVTGCKKIGSFRGRVCRMDPLSNHRDAWHDDLVDSRMIALSINLSTEVYSGGTLQIKDLGSDKIVHEVANTGFGDAIIFRIAPYLNHRLTEVTGKFSRTFFAGWFRSFPLYKPIFKSLESSDLCLGNNRELFISRNSIVQRREDLYFRDANEKSLVFNPKNEICYGLDPIGREILTMITKPKKISEIKNIILNKYDVEIGRCENDLLNLLQTLQANDIITVQDKITI